MEAAEAGTGTLQTHSRSGAFSPLQVSPAAVLFLFPKVAIFLSASAQSSRDLDTSQKRAVPKPITVCGQSPKTGAAGATDELPQRAHSQMEETEPDLGKSMV